jgi:carbamoyl-phosphate synthase large subunit
MTGVTSAAFEPALDYVVIKMPRWDLQKFKASSRRIGTEMKSVGEVMAIGRTFEEALQKAIRSISIGADGLTSHPHEIDRPFDEIEFPTDRRLYAIADALLAGTDVAKINKLSDIDPWFLNGLKRIVDVHKQLKSAKVLTPELLKTAKQHGFSDKQIGGFFKKSADDIRALRKKKGIVPVVKRIDTLAGEFPAQSNYLYMTYHGTENDVVAGPKDAVMVLGGGSYRIGSSVEFDWCSVEAIKAIQSKKRQAIMVNCNPETVSTDYDMCDRLYFEELTLERVLDIHDVEKPAGVIVSMGGQIPNNLAMPLMERKVKILGTDPRNIDRAEDRKKFSQLLDRLNVVQPEWKELAALSDAKAFAKRVGYPVLIRPSYVLSGAAMNIAHNEDALTQFLKEAADVSKEHPVVITKFMEDAREIEIDGVAQNGELVIYALTEHVENAGVHSGDATIATPPQKSYLETVRRMKHVTREIIAQLEITGPFNIQFLAKRNEISVIELNLRASRSMPFVSKATKYPMIQMATRAMLGDDIHGNYNTLDVDYVVVKAPQFSYSRIKGADPVLYVEMGSTGEVATFGRYYREAVLKSLLAADFRMPKKNVLLSIGGDKAKQELAPYIKKLHKMGLHLYATKHTAQFIRYDLGLPVTEVAKMSERATGNTLSLIQDGGVDCIFNIPTIDPSTDDLSNGFLMRRAAIDHNVQLIANMQLTKTVIMALHDVYTGAYTLEVKAWDEYVRPTK